MRGLKQSELGWEIHTGRRRGATIPIMGDEGAEADRYVVMTSGELGRAPADRHRGFAVHQGERHDAHAAAHSPVGRRQRAVGRPDQVPVRLIPLRPRGVFLSTGERQPVVCHVLTTTCLADNQIQGHERLGICRRTTGAVPRRHYLVSRIQPDGGTAGRRERVDGRRHERAAQLAREGGRCGGTGIHRQMHDGLAEGVSRIVVESRATRHITGVTKYACPRRAYVDLLVSSNVLSVLDLYLSAPHGLYPGGCGLQLHTDRSL